MVLQINMTSNIKIKKITNEISTENTPRWDSLAHFEIILELEKKTKKNIRTDQMSELNSVNKLLEFFLYFILFYNNIYIFFF